jgi:phage tail-like protein
VSNGPETTIELIRAFNFRVSLVQSRAGVEGARDPVVAERRNENNPQQVVLGDGGFQECTGLEVELDVQELQEGGRNDGVIRRVGRAKYQPIVLKRGMLAPPPQAAPPPPTPSPPARTTEFWTWLQEIASGTNVRRFDGTVEVLDPARAKVVARWTFVRGLPAKVTGPQLNARTGEIAIEELHIAHEGLTLELQ